ncbi:hypothetical protein [Melittangium boletus]|uniref:Uncharacterized protein n=1 Tax=Melittangium boletus DSM 14713 TaxID=1294270 RepID=A0A250IPX5_9BACT|nr:hypothetical protein [Melittangium boletus]ATB33292.1 hypothetical protein MEBOL_006783 [Melittangium boletus DSM 14713]
MATIALGPTFAGGLQPIVEEGYELIYLPDVNNDALQREGKAPVFCSSFSEPRVMPWRGRAR